jgi:polyhydroxyalkanoate synthesis regulator phasin
MLIVFSAPKVRANKDWEENMLELLKKSVLAGLGAVVVTRDKIREATKSLVEEGKLSTDEAEKLGEELVKSGERQWEEFNDKFQTSMKKVSDNLEVVRKKDFLELKAKVELLEQRIQLLEETHRQNP